MSLRNGTIFARFRRGQDGNATIEFVFLFPAFIFLFLTGFEAGYYMVKDVMLEHAVNVAIRDVRLGIGSGQTKAVEFTDLKKRICNEALIIADCMNSLQVEMQPVATTPGSVAAMNGPARCVDKDASDDPMTATTFDYGTENQMMMLRVCALSKPLFPTTLLGMKMRADGRGNYALVTAAAFVNEPGARGVAQPSGS